MHGYESISGWNSARCYTRSTLPQFFIRLEISHEWRVFRWMRSHLVHTELIAPSVEVREGSRYNRIVSAAKVYINQNTNVLKEHKKQNIIGAESQTIQTEVCYEATERIAKKGWSNWHRENDVTRRSYPWPGNSMNIAVDPHTQLRTVPG